MTNSISLKVYNKDDKLKMSIRQMGSLNDKVISLYKYYGETVYIHSYVIVDSNKENFKPYHAYYEMRKEVGGFLVESVMVTEEEIEIKEIINNSEEIVKSIKLKTGNEYETRTKEFDGELFKIEFLNNKVYDFKFKIKEKKINEYLKTINNE